MTAARSLRRLAAAVLSLALAALQPVTATLGLALLLVAAQPGLAQVTASSVTVPFDGGFIGTTGQNTGKANSSLSWGTLGVLSVTFTQPSPNGQFGGTQGNDLSGTLTVMTQTQTIKIPGAINWRITVNGKVNVFGFIPDPLAPTQYLTYPGGVLALDSTRNYGMRKFGYVYTFVDNTDVSGNAALSGLVDELNAYLAELNFGTTYPPTITGPDGVPGAGTATISVNENQTAVATYQGSGAAGPVTFSITGGTDAARFAINATTGVLTFLAPPNFEGPTDTDVNNTYQVRVTATGPGGASHQLLTVTVLDLPEPLITGPSGGAGAAASAISVNENQTAVTTLTSPNAPTWSILGGTDASRFAINASTGVITFLAAPNFEAPTDTDTDTNNTYVLQVQARTSNGFTALQTVTVTVLDVPEPLITGPSGGAGAAASAVSVPENQTAVAAFTSPHSPTWAIIGGVDAARFAINATTGVLTFLAAPNFELPTDTGPNNIYDLQIRATTANGNTATQSVAVTVTDVNEPVITGPTGGAGAAASAISVNENQTGVATLSSPFSPTWAIVGGTDAARFAINATTGVLTFVAAPDYELPNDSNTDRIYVLQARATLSNGTTATQTVTVTVLDLPEPVITGPSGVAGAASSAVSIPENQTAVATFTSPNSPTWSIVGGVDAARFTIDATTGALTFLVAPNYEAPTDTGPNNVYDLQVLATTAGGTATQSVAVTVTDVVEPLITGPSGGAAAASSAVSVNENQTAVTTFSGVNITAWAIIGGADASRFAINAATGVLTFQAAPDFETPTDAGTNNIYDLQIRATASNGTTATQLVAVTVLDVVETPVITGPSGVPGATTATITVPENQTSVFTFG